MRRTQKTNQSPTYQLVHHHSRTQTAALDSEDSDDDEDSPYPLLLRVSQEYGNIRMGMGSNGGGPSGASGSGVRHDGPSTASVQETRTNKFLPSKSTDRLLSSVEGASIDEDIVPETNEKTVIWETSFTEHPASEDPKPTVAKGPAVEKLISITPTSPKPPENVLSRAIDSDVTDKSNHKNALVPEKKTAPIASPDPPRINAKKDPKYNAKPKPLCLDAAQLEQNLNALKKNSGSVNLTTMNILPPYINVVTPNKLSEVKTIQIDPKKAVIDDLPKDMEKTDEKIKLKQSNSAASLLNGPMTDVPYADSDNTSSSSSGNVQNGKDNVKNNKLTNSENKIIKQGSNGGEHIGDSEISC